MEREQWYKIENIVDKALQFEDFQQQASYIEKVCKGNRQLYVEVQLLIRAIHDAEKIGFME